MNDGTLDPERRHVRKVGKAKIYDMQAWKDSLKETLAEVFSKRELDDIKAELDRLNDKEDPNI
jgi:hypothetical protein